MSLHLAAPTQVQRVTFTREAAYTFCFLDFTNIRGVAEAVATTHDAARQIAECAPRSLRILTDVMGSKMSIPVIAALQDLARANEPYVERSAVIGLALPHRVALRQLRRITGRDIREFGSRDEAFEYLLA
jgi:hypothetical protein